MPWNWAKFAPVGLVIFGVALIATSQLFGLPGVGAQAGATYHVDCANGNDKQKGTSPANAWKSLAPVKNANLSAGDALLFKRDCTWEGPLRAKWNGSAAAPIRIGAYGNGALPKFAHGSSTNVLITGSFQIIEDLQTQHVVGDYKRIEPDGQPSDWKIGFNFQDGAHHNTIQRVRTSGHAVGVNFSDNAHHNRVLDSFIGNNFGIWSNATAATGVLLHGDSNEIAYNRFENNSALKRPNQSVSLEIFNNTRGNIHHNVSYDRKFAEMGSGNITSADNVIAYNTHWSNYQPEGNAKGSLFVVSRGPGCKFGPVKNTMLYNNTVYLSGKNSQGVSAGCTKGANVITMKNNIIVAREKGYYLGGGGAEESHNVFWAAGGAPIPNNFLQGQPMSGTSQIANPQFVDPQGRDLRLKASSPATNAGALASDGLAETPVQEPVVAPIVDPIVEPEIPGSVALPGRIEAENYRKGGEGVGYHDTTPENLGGAYRNDGVDLQPTTDIGGGHNVGWPDAGEWLAYDVSVATAGDYSFTVRVASLYDGRSFHLELNGENVTGSIAVPNTSGWQNWTDVTSDPVTIPAGNHTLRLVAETDGYNVNYIDVTESQQAMSAQTTVATVAPADATPADATPADAASETLGAPVASFIVACDDVACSFDGAASTGAIETYSWDFGDGSSESGATVSHSYKEGAYPATLTVTDGSGQSSAFSQEVVVFTSQEVVVTSAESQSTASFVHSCDALARTCAFDASQSEGDISGYEWNFGDGSTVAAGEIVSHAYSAGGNYTVTLTVANGSGTDDASQNVVLPFTMHVGDLDGSLVVDQGGSTAAVTVTVHDEDDKPTADVTVVGTWSNNVSTEMSCTTDANGVCTIDNGDVVGTQPAGVVFAISGLSHVAYVYDQAANHSPEQGDTDDDEGDGTSIVVGQTQ
ncbi:hypothetical protein BH23CHL1_BH23CHL1_04660 [soil metagenome]